MRWFFGLDVFCERFGLLDFKLISEVMRANLASSNFGNLTFLLGGMDCAAKGDEAVQGDDLDILAVQ